MTFTYKRKMQRLPFLIWVASFRVIISSSIHLLTNFTVSLLLSKCTITSLSVLLEILFKECVCHLAHLSVKGCDKND